MALRNSRIAIDHFRGFSECADSIIHYRINDVMLRAPYKETKIQVQQKKDAVMEFYGLPPIGQKQRHPARPRGLPGAQMGPSFISPWVGNVGGRLQSSQKFCAVA
jgi:hypothetical protein